MATINDIAARVKAHPGIAGANVTGLSDDDFASAVALLIIVCLHPLALSSAGDKGKRHYVLTDPAATTVALDVDGIGNLTSLIASQGILLESLAFGEITHPDSDFPLVPAAGSAEGGLPGNFDDLFIHYWLVGPKIHTRSVDNNVTPLTGNLSLAVPRVGGLDTLSSQLEDDLVERIVNRLRAAPVPEKAGVK